MNWDFKRIERKFITLFYMNALKTDLIKLELRVLKISHETSIFDVLSWFNRFYFLWLHDYFSVLLSFFQNENKIEDFYEISKAFSIFSSSNFAEIIEQSTSYITLLCFWSNCSILFNLRYFRLQLTQTVSSW